METGIFLQYSSIRSSQHGRLCTDPKISLGPRLPAALLEWSASHVITGGHLFPAKGEMAILKMASALVLTLRPLINGATSTVNTAAHGRSGN